MSKFPLLGLAVLVIHLVLGLLCLAAARGDGRLRSVRYWGWGMLIYAGGLLISVPTPWVSRAAIFTLANTVIAYAPIPFVQGLLSLTSRRLDKRWTGGALALIVAVLLWNNQFGPQLRPINMSVPTLMAIGLFLWVGGVLLRQPVPAARNASRFLAWVMLFCAATFAARTAILWPLVSDETRLDQGRLVIELFGIVQILVSVMGMLCLFWIEVLKMEHRLSSMAYGDALTGLANRRATMMRFEEMLSLARRQEQLLALVMFDIDFFKKVNDAHGHQAGDHVLQHISALLSSGKRQEDMLGRIGGEEFILLLPNTGVARALMIAERLRELIESTPAQADGVSIAVTVSGGLAAFPEDGDSWDQLFAVVDRRLYRSKGNGRNQITTSG